MQFEHMPQGFSLKLIKDLGEQGNGVECIRATHWKALALACSLVIKSLDKGGHSRSFILHVRTLTIELAKANNLAPDTRYVAFKTSGCKSVRAAIAIANYLAPILEDDDDGAVSALGRLEHVNAVFIAKLVRAIRIAMLEYTEAKRSGYHLKARTTKDAKRPVVIRGGVTGSLTKSTRRNWRLS
jgi:hypothetical protein